MHKFANEKYKVFQQLWTTFDNFSVWISIALSFFLLLTFLMYGVLDSNLKIGKLNAIILTGLFARNFTVGSEKAILFIVLAVCFFMVEIEINSLRKHLSNN